MKNLQFILTMLILLIFVFQISIINIYSQKMGNNIIIGGEELILELKGNNFDPQILKFQIPASGYTEICPSNQCTLELTDTALSAPTPDDSSPTIYASVNFFLHDNITNANLTKAQKLFIEKFYFSISCSISSIDQIVQDKDGNVVYHCNDPKWGASLGPLESSSPLPTLNYPYYVTYDTKSEILNVSGKIDIIKSDKKLSSEPTNLNNYTINETITQKQERTFNDCYSGFVGSLLLYAAVSPIEFDMAMLMEKDFKLFITNLCNFYHEKSGKWVSPYGDEVKKYGAEFYEKYGKTIPQKLKLFVEQN